MDKALTLKVQIYKSISATGGPQIKKPIKKYIYNKMIYDNGGLWANLRDLSQGEIVRNAQVDIVTTTELILNYNNRLAQGANDLWVEFTDARTKQVITYQIQGDADLYDHITRRIKMQLVQRKDNTDYGGIEYDI